jgi:hemerythrin-like metal-binding protein
MHALNWSERYLTGLPRIDADRAKLVSLINEFGQQTTHYTELPPGRLEETLDQLIKYASTHFVAEESMMTDLGLDPRHVALHQSEHERFLRDVGELRASRLLDAAETAQLLLRFLLQWVAFHLLGMDKALGRQVVRIRSGQTPEQAWAAEADESEGPAQLLLGALDDLLRIIGQRNAQLIESNKLLEVRVVERTAALQASNAQLRATVEALRATQVKLIESEKLASVGQLASGLAHEINNPLAFISANLSVLGEHTKSLFHVVDAAQAVAPQVCPPLAQALSEAEPAFIKKDVSELLSETREGVNRVQTIVRDLKSFSYVDGGPVLDLDLQGCVESTLRVLAARGRSGVSFVTDFGPMTRVRCRAAQVSHVVLNLLQNAIQAVHDSGAHGTISLRTGVEAGFGFIEVKDTGVGMTPEVLSRAFEPFFTTRPAGNGSGLGLTTAVNCAQAHGGRLDATSERGVGTVMRLLLPLEPPEALSPK